MTNHDQAKNYVFKMDIHQEIFDLWYENFFLKKIIGKIASNLPDHDKLLTHDFYEDCRKEAQNSMKERFPTVLLDYSIKLECGNEKNNT